MRVLVPLMPTADDLLPLLRTIDARQVYVNGGPLVRRLEATAARMLSAPTVAVSNGTLAIELALRALDLPRGAEVLVPSVTYVATGQAIINAGLTPVLVDVCPITWQLTADMAAACVASRPSIRAVVPVAAFGLAVPVAPWERFNFEHDRPVIIDAAGALMQQRLSPQPDIVACFSLHATKAVGAGEGGLVATTDRTLLARVADLAAFGDGGTNAKMSEYHAAVGLTSLEADRLEALATATLMLETAYRQHLPPRCTLQAGVDQTHRTLLPVRLPPPYSADAIARRLAADDIETRRWYAPFLHQRPQFAACPRLGALPVASALADELIGLPFHYLMTVRDAHAVCTALSRALSCD